MRQLKINKSITNRSSAALDKYLVEIGREELISTDEEVELAQRIHKGDQEALERLTKANLRFVVSVAKQYQNQGLALNDLIDGLGGHVKIKTGRFNQHISTHAILVEVGNNKNTLTQALNAMPYLAQAIKAADTALSGL